MVNKWSPEYTGRAIDVWIMVQDVPLNLWDVDFFRFLVTSGASLLELTKILNIRQEF